MYVCASSIYRVFMEGFGGVGTVYRQKNECFHNALVLQLILYMYTRETLRC